jgi:hypothetical protein
MTDAPQNRSLERPQQAKERLRETSRSRERTDARPLTDTARPIAETAKAAKKRPGLQMEEAIVTPGQAGESNIVIEKFWVEVDGHLPAGFNVTTRPEHQLEVTLEQRSYRKNHSGTGTVKTGLTPIAPIGTKGRVIARDATTGETVEQPWTWKSRGGFGGLWQFIKRLLWKG